MNDILDFAQINSGKFRKDNRNLNIKTSIEDVMLIMETKAEEQSIQTSLELHGFPKDKNNND